MKNRCIDPAVGDLLAAYELGLTSESESERFETHVLNCERCLARLEQFSNESHALRHDAALRDTVQEALTSRRPTHSRRAYRDLLWPADFPWLLRPAISLCALLATIVIALAGWLQAPGVQPVSAVMPIELSPLRSSTVTSYTLLENRDGLLSFAYPGAIEGGMYKIHLSRDRETVFEVDTFSTFDEFGLGRLSIPGTLLKPGTYVLTIRPMSEASDSTAISYRFELSRP